jgi:hypothetical protein
MRSMKSGGPQWHAATAGAGATSAKIGRARHGRAELELGHMVDDLSINRAPGTVLANMAKVVLAVTPSRLPVGGNPSDRARTFVADPAYHLK